MCIPSIGGAEVFAYTGLIERGGQMCRNTKDERSDARDDDSSTKADFIIKTN